MKRRTVTQCIRMLPRETLKAAFLDTPHPERFDVKIPASPRTVAGFGVYYHQAFDSAVRGQRVDRDVYPFVRAELDMLENLGVREAYAEWHHFTPMQGVVDASVAGGPNEWGVLENKIALHAPHSGYAEDIAQVTMYCALAAHHNRPLNRLWVGLCYILPEQLRLRLLVWRDARPLVRSLHDALRMAHTSAGKQLAIVLEPVYAEN